MGNLQKNRQTMVNPWILLAVAGLFESAFAFCLGKARIAQGNEAMYWYSGFAVCLLISMYLLIRSLEFLPVGTAYAVWTGIGAVGSVVIGIFFFKEPAGFLRLFFVFTLIGSIIGLRLCETN